MDARAHPWQIDESSGSITPSAHISVKHGDVGNCIIVPVSVPLKRGPQLSKTPRREVCVVHNSTGGKPITRRDRNLVLYTIHVITSTIVRFVKKLLNPLRRHSIFGAVELLK